MISLNHVAMYWDSLLFGHHGKLFVSKLLIQKIVLCVSRIDSIGMKIDSIVRKIDSVKKK